FGEKYVDLVPPPHSSARPVHAGDVITQDRTKPPRPAEGGPNGCCAATSNPRRRRPAGRVRRR
ncbi:hypothetical protein ACWD4N_44110, partial [Streptomyces sp. NPDC002586]